MQPDPIPYLAVVERPPIRWPGGARVAFWLSPNIEHYQCDPPHNPHRRAWPRLPAPDTLAWSYRDYGNRVGFWRMLEVLDRYPIRPTASVNIAALELYPEIRDAVVAREWEVMSHGLHNTEFLFGMTPMEEEAYLRENVERAERATGTRPYGFFGPAASMTPDTMDLLVRTGFRYSADWYVDDEPFPVRAHGGRLIALPYSWEVNDALVMEHGFGRQEMDDFVRICKDQFDTLYGEGAERGRVMHIALHPFVVGRPHRVGYLDEILDYVLGHEAVWCATGSEIAAYYDEHCYDGVIAELQARGRWPDGPEAGA